MHNVKPDRDERKLYDTLDALESESLVFGRRFINDSKVRTRYKLDTKKYCGEILDKVKNGKLSASEGAKQANALRNKIMEASRLKTSDVGLAIVKAEKKFGITLPHAENKYSEKLFSTEFSKLATSQKKKVWLSVIESAMSPNASYNNLSRLMGYSGHALAITAYAIAIYRTLKAKNKLAEGEQQAVVLASSSVGGSIGGAIASGALFGGETGAEVGAFGGPLDPITVPLGVFLGSILGGGVAFLARSF
jgi:hypothetical protein